MLIRAFVLSLLASLALAASSGKAASQLQVGVKYKPENCPLKTRKGDKLSMQWVEGSTMLTAAILGPWHPMAVNSTRR